MSQTYAANSMHGWIVYLLHGIDDDGGYSIISSDVLRESLEFYHANRDIYWISSFVNVIRYIRERNAVSILNLRSTSDTIKIQVSDTLDNTIYNYPLSIRCPLPEGWGSARAFQEGDAIYTVVQEVTSAKYIVFDAVPDAGEVKIVSTDY
jgi:oligosaccharide reducing-end xylanase